MKNYLTNSEYPMQRNLTLKTMGILLATFVLLTTVPFSASAGYVYNEDVDGDLPHPNMANILPFAAPGPNMITFTLDLYSDGWIVDVPSGHILESFTLIEFMPNDPTYSATFHMYDGPTQDDPVLGTLWASFSNDMVGVDFLSHYLIHPLGEGQYLFNFWHDGNDNHPTLTFDIGITAPIPVEESTWGSVKAIYK